MKVSKVFLCLSMIILLFTLSCSEEEEGTTSTQDLSSEVLSIIADADEFEAMASTDRILRRSSIPDKEGIRRAMIRAKGLIAHLDREPNDVKAINHLRFTLINLQGFNLSERDAPRVLGLMDRMNRFYVRYSKAAGIEPGEVFSTLFQYNLAVIESPDFGIFNFKDSAWQKPSEQLNRYVLSAKGDAHSWLISPRFDFTKTLNTSIRLKHSFNINRSNRENKFDLQLMKREIFKIMYSEKFKGGAPTSVNDWKEVNMGELPRGQDFHEVDTGILNVKEFAGKKITIAFVYHNDTKKYGRHFISWNILRFDLLGTTDQFGFTPYSDGLRTATKVSSWKANDLKDFALDGFEQREVSGAPGEFRVADFRGNFYVRVNGQNLTGEVDLYTPLYDLAGIKNPAVQLSHASKFYPASKHSLKLLRLLVAENPSDGTPWADLNWQDLNLNTENIGDGYNAVPSNWLPLPENLKGKKVNFAFRWKANGTDAPLWDLHGFTLGDLDD